MSLRSEKLARTLDEIQQFIATRLHYRDCMKESVQQMERSLTTLAHTLQKGKLKLHIASCNLELAEALFNWINQQPLLASAYEIKIIPPLCETLLPAPEPMTHLILQASFDPALQHPLNALETLVIGRHPACQMVVPDHYLLVSGHHAQLKPVSAINHCCMQWQLCDLESRNGTYINGQPVQGYQLLQEGDRITLGLPYPTETCPEFMIELAEMSNRFFQSRNEWIDCDVLCSITDSSSAQIQEWQYFKQLQQIQQIPITKQIALVLTSDETLFTEVQDWCERELPQLESFKLSVDQFHIKDEDIQLFPEQQTELNRLQKCLKMLVKRKPEDILIKRLSTQVMCHLDWVESMLEREERSLEIEICRSLAKLEDTTPSFSPERLDQEYKEISTDVTLFFKQAKDRLKQSRSDLLDDYLENSILNKIRRFTDQLKLYIAKQNNQKYLQLKLSIIAVEGLVKTRGGVGAVPPRRGSTPAPRPNQLFDCYIQRERANQNLFVAPNMSGLYNRRNFKLRRGYSLRKNVKTWNQSRQKSIKCDSQERTIDANTALLNFCYSELTCWIDREWEYLWRSPVHHNLEGLWQRGYDLLNSTSSLNSPYFSSIVLQPAPPINHQLTVDETFAKAVCETRHQEPSPVVHILKKIRSQWMQFIFIFSLFSILGIAGRRQMMQYLTAPIITTLKAYPFPSTLFLMILLYFLVKFLVSLYRQDRDLEREKEVKKLRDGLCSYYQALVKNRLTDKYLQHLLTTLEKEEKKLHEMLTVAEQSMKISKFNLEQDQKPIQENLRECQEKQRTISEVKKRVEKFKRSCMASVSIM